MKGKGCFLLHCLTFPLSCNIFGDCRQSTFAEESMAIEVASHLLFLHFYSAKAPDVFCQQIICSEIGAAAVNLFASKRQGCIERPLILYTTLILLLAPVTVRGWSRSRSVRLCAWSILTIFERYRKTTITNGQLGRLLDDTVASNSSNSEYGRNFFPYWILAMQEGTLV